MAGAVRRFAVICCHVESMNVRALVIPASVAAVRCWFRPSATVARSSRRYFVNAVAIRKHHSIMDSLGILRLHRTPKQKDWASHGSLAVLSATMSAGDCSTVSSIDANRSAMLRMNKSLTAHTLPTW
ncbi:hypothetical protein PFICI_01468 [Pestalotiopsis fici W106-1]|uniref:Uncharacterized protein n=1 Tax=Pestalotiopsis fici (strain W106-1 / CGMCC3.15140) TaxID=1229662 RepID=W3XNV1_PESFW|nr:uncharacterized protein PFICI_01468 [Pestalotiopsis fici W106-1]ETS87640.1 hypothetical protein PFICI_01468 [Pestalotiopsis fici W106-1]